MRIWVGTVAILLVVFGVKLDFAGAGVLPAGESRCWRPPMRAQIPLSMPICRKPHDVLPRLLPRLAKFGWGPGLIEFSSSFERVFELSSQAGPGQSAAAFSSAADAPGEMEASVLQPSCANCEIPTTRLDTEAIGNIHSYLRQSVLHPAAQAARKVMAVIYQNCEALGVDLPFGYRKEGYRHPDDGVLSHLENPNRYIDARKAAKSNPYLRAKYDGVVCRDMQKTPPVFHVGGKAAFRNNSRGQLEVDVFNNHRNLSGGNLVTLDCSGFVSASFATAGLKFRPSSDPGGAYQFSTAAMLDLVGRPAGESCIESAKFTATESLRSGDIFVMRDPQSNEAYGHVMMFESVGPDPFALNGITHPSQCESGDGSIDATKWDFTVIHSSNHSGRMAVTRTDAAHYFLAEDNGLYYWLYEMAVHACRAKFRSAPQKAEHAPSIRTKDGKTRRQLVMAVARHVGAARPGCVEARPIRVVGEDCVEGCQELKK